MKIFIVFLITITFLFSCYSFSQCDDCNEIEKKYDDFEEQTIISMLPSNLDGGGFLSLVHGNLSTKVFFQKNDTVYTFEFRLVNPENLVFLEGETSLKIKTDNGKFNYKAYNCQTIVGEQFNIYVMNYTYELDDLYKMISSKEVVLRVYPTNGGFIEFTFDEDVFKCYKCFYKKYLDKK